MSDRIEVDDIRFKLREVFSFYGKDLDDSAERVWINALSGHSADAVIQAFDRHIAGASGNASSYAPKPRHIIELLPRRSEEHTSELQSRGHLVCRLLLETKK